jgi:hypothetical protein
MKPLFQTMEAQNVGFVSDHYSIGKYGAYVVSGLMVDSALQLSVSYL